MHRTPPEGTKMPPLRVLPALLLLLLFVTAPPLHCSAAVSNSSSGGTRTGMILAASNRATSIITGCFPGVIFYGTSRKYRCETRDFNPPDGVQLCTIHGASTSGCIWDASISGYSVSFTAGGRWSTSGDVPLTFAMIYESFVVLQTNPLTSPFMRPSETTASFTVLNPYYGMSMSVDANFPSSQTVARHVLLDTNAEFPEVITQCSIENHCYDATNMRLPPPGTYKLCMSGEGWNDYLLPWGTATVSVSPLVVTPMSLANGIVPSIELQNGDTGAVVTPAKMKMYLVRCATGTCPSVTPLRGDPMVSVSACDETTANRVQLLITALNAPVGTYALCVMDRNNKFSPTALPVTVLQDPFTMEVSGASTGHVTLRVSGGDLATRMVRYAVCIAENGASCSIAGLDESKCTWSGTFNTETVEVDVREVANGRINFCLVSKRVTFNGHTYLDVQAEAPYMKGGDGGMPIWLVILIVLGCVSVVGGVILAVCCWRRRRAHTEEESFVDKDWNRRNSMSLSSRSFADSMRSAGQGSVYGDQLHSGHIPSVHSGHIPSVHSGYIPSVHSGYIPSVHSSSYSLRADPEEEMRRASHYGNWM